MSEASVREDLLNELAHEYVDRYRHGGRPPLSEYAARHPELADEIRELFPALLLMEQCAAAVRPEDGLPALTTADGLVPDRLDEYRILREVARGGMGIVYEAVQESLGRHVALKILPDQPWRQASLVERFRREARSAAQLHHTNIVPVFGTGRHGGIHYYAMQFIQGQSLERVLCELRQLRNRSRGDTAPAANAVQSTPDNGDGSSMGLADALWTGRLSTTAGPESPARDIRRPAHEDPTSPSGRASAQSAANQVGGRRADSTAGGAALDATAQSEQPYFRHVARMGIQAAEALDYAHGLGVLHRDIKPSNLLLDAHGTLWVTDFGLAKAEGTDELTSPGDIVGTLRYMAPERFQGIADARSDLYSLGLTLYEMLTLEPAFAHSDRQQLIQQVVAEEPPPPRMIEPRIPRDLETIVLKAIDKEARRRYASAALLAEDLQRFLDDRPLLARRSTWVEQFQRWCRRNPVVASLAAVLAVLLLTVAMGATAAAHYFHDLAQREEQTRQQAESLAREIQDNLDRQNRAFRLLESAQDHVRMNRLAVAHADLSEAVRLRPDNPLALSGRGLLCATTLAWDAAAADLNRAFELYASREASEWFTYASLRLYCGDREGYHRACTAAAEYFGTPDPRSCSWIVETCTLGADSRVNPGHMMWLAEIALHSDPKSQAYLAIMGRACFRAGDHARAMRYLDELNAQDDGWVNSEAWPVMAMVCFRLGRLDEARRWLEKTRRGLDETTLWIAQHPFDQYLIRRGKFNLLAVYLLYREAQQLIDPTDKDHPVRWVVQGWGCARLGLAEQAMSHFSQAVAERPDDWRTWMARWQYRVRCGRFRDAADDLQKMLSDKPDESWDWCCYALLRLDAGDLSEYRRACVELKQRYFEPGHPWKGQQLALMCALAPESTADPWPARLAEQAMEADPKNPWFILTSALVHFRAGSFQNLPALLARAQEGPWPEPYLEDSGKAIVRALLTLSSARLGREEEARRWFKLSARGLEQWQPDESTGDWGPAWHTWLVCRILLREAAPIVKPQEGRVSAEPPHKPDSPVVKLR